MCSVRFSSCAFNHHLDLGLSCSTPKLFAGGFAVHLLVIILEGSQCFFSCKDALLGSPQTPFEDAVCVKAVLRSRDEG